MMESVEDKVCTGTKHKEINSSTDDKENKQVNEGNIVSSSTVNTDQVQYLKTYNKDSAKEASTEDQVGKKN